AGDVGMRGDEVDDGAHFRLGGGVGTGAGLLALGPPSHGKVAVEVETLLLALHADRDAVIVVDAPFGQDAIVLSAALVGRAAHHQARLVGRNLPTAVGVGDAHEQHATVT